VIPCWGYGFYADLNPQNNRTIAFRADMDALPIQEHNSHSFVSKVANVAHMCGHDSHMAIALTTARIIAEDGLCKHSNVRFIFQPSEEKHPGGALGMIENGCLHNVAEIYSLHNMPELETGQIATKPGVLTAASDRFDIVFHGRSGHAARPWECADPVVAASQFVTNIQAITARQIEPSQAAVISVTQMEAGSTYNVIPEKAYLKGCVRTLEHNRRELIQNQLEYYLQAANTKWLKTSMDYQKGYDPIVNHEHGVARIVRSAKTFLEPKQIDTSIQPLMVSEDFSYYLQHTQGAFLLLGSGNADKGITASLHSDKADIDEDALPVGAALMASLAVDFCV
jgi:amidohydrolase